MSTKMPDAAQHDRLDALLAQLSLDQKVALVQGADVWSTAAVPEIGLSSMVLSDGPAGVRGPRWDERDPSLNLPSGSALGASWSEDLAYRYGAVAAAEARRKGVHVVLGPTINLHRSPLGGRHFECLSEDPHLTGVLAAAYVRGLQDHGVAATPKHYVANDSETERFTVDIRVDDRTLREVYLAPFEYATAAGVWAVMSSYNSVNGTTMTENDLLETPLSSEWGFDGVVISDWTAVRSVAAAQASQDLAMPGPVTGWADLAEAVRDGRVAEADIDRKVLRLLRLAQRVGALSGGAECEPNEIDGVAFAREAAATGAVLLANDGTLPLRPGATVAVSGQNARDTRTQGGGSATVLPVHTVSVLDGLLAALGDDHVSYNTGAVSQEGVSPLPLALLTNPVSGGHGIHVVGADENGDEVFAEDRFSSALVWFGGDVPLDKTATLTLRTTLTATESEIVRIGFAGTRRCRLYADDQLILDDHPSTDGMDLGAAFLNPPSATALLQLTADQDVELRAEVVQDHDTAIGLSLTLGLAPNASNPDQLIADAARAAAAADVAVVVVGTNSVVESEGYDRIDLRLPGRQDDLVRAVAAANPRTIVIVNAGSPVELPWAGDVAAIVQAYFGGQEMGHAIADILTGAVEPGGRLPTTWPRSIEDVPVLEVAPTHGALDYAEGVHVGYRAWLRDGATPAFPFGHGLGYTTWDISRAVRDGDDLVVTVTNTGDRVGTHIVQVYAERPDSVVDRPVRWLVGHAEVSAAPGETTTVRIPLPARRFAYWDAGWQIEAGTFTLHVGSSVSDCPLAVGWPAGE